MLDTFCTSLFICISSSIAGVLQHTYSDEKRWKDEYWTVAVSVTCQFTFRLA